MLERAEDPLDAALPLARLRPPRAMIGESASRGRAAAEVVAEAEVVAVAKVAAMSEVVAAAEGAMERADRASTIDGVSSPRPQTIVKKMPASAR